MDGRRSQLDDVRGQSPEKVRVWWEPTDEKARSDYGGAWWPATVLDKHKNRYRVRYDNGDEEEIHADHVSPLDTLPFAFGEEEALAVGEFAEVFNGSQTDPCAWLGRVKCGLDAGTYVVEYPFHDSAPEKIKAKDIRRARVMEDGEWRLIKPAQTWADGEVTSPQELELIYEDMLAEELQALEQAKAGGGGNSGGGGKRETGGQPQASGASKRARGESGAAGPRAVGAGMRMDGMLSLSVTVDPVEGDRKFCFMPVPAGAPVPPGAIQVFFHQNDVPQLRSAVVADTSAPARREAPAKKPAGRPRKDEGSGAPAQKAKAAPRTAEQLYTDQFLRSLHSTTAPSPLTTSQASKAAAKAWAGAAPNVRQKYEEMAAGNDESQHGH